MVVQPTVLPDLRTERLILRDLRQSDAEDIFRYACKPEITRYLLWDSHKSLEDTNRFIDLVIDGYKCGEPTNWGIELEATGRVIGTIGFHRWRAQHASVEIGYVMSDEYWNQGYMTEVVQAVLDYLLGTLELNRVEAHCIDNNKASERVMEKVGMQYEGTLREAIFVKGRFHNLRLHSILRVEYLKRKGLS